MKYTINVTEDDIKIGKPNEYASCPVALAVERGTRQICEVFPLYSHGMVAIYFPSRIGDDRKRIVKDAEDVRQFIMDFDMGKYVKPVSFEIDLD